MIRDKLALLALFLMLVVASTVLIRIGPVKAVAEAGSDPLKIKQSGEAPTPASTPSNQAIPNPEEKEKSPGDDTDLSGSGQKGTASLTLEFEDELSAQRRWVVDKYPFLSPHVDAYLKAAERSQVPWQILAAIHKKEFNYRGDNCIIGSDGVSKGPFQFSPTTFNKNAVEVEGKLLGNICKVEDSAYAAANLIRTNWNKRGSLWWGVMSYNNDSESYANQIFQIARSLDCPC